MNLKLMVAGLTAAAAFAAAPVAGAAVIAEPNDSMGAAYGPLASGTTYDGFFDNRGDDTDLDFLKFTAAGASPTITVANTTADCGIEGTNSCWIGVRLLDAAGELALAGSDGFRPRILPGASETITTYGLTSGGTYYLQITTGGACRTYGVTVNGSSGAPAGQGNRRSCSDAGSDPLPDGESKKEEPKNDPKPDAGKDGTPEGPATGGGEPSSCIRMAEELRTLDARRDADKRELDQARRRYAAAKGADEKRALKALMLRERDQLQQDLVALAAHLKAMAKANCRCAVAKRELDNASQAIRQLRKQLRELRSKSRTRARRQAIGRANAKLDAADRLIAARRAELKKRGCS